MTLYINVLRTENMLEGGLLVVEGSKAGLLACQNVGKNANLNPVFNIKCASDDILTFKLSRNLQEYENNRIISQGSIHAQSLTKRYRNQLLGYNMGSNQPTSQIRTSDIRNSSTGNEQLFRSSGIRNSSLPQSSLNYDVQLFSPEEKYSGLLHTTISYDPVSHFEGQFCSAAQKKRVENKQKVALFKGKCPTKNLFSILDPACENQQNKFIESIYKDGELTYKQL